MFYDKKRLIIVVERITERCLFYFSITIIAILVIAIPISIWKLESQNYAFGDTLTIFITVIIITIITITMPTHNKIRIHKPDFHYHNSILTILITILYK